MEILSIRRLYFMLSFFISVFLWSDKLMIDQANLKINHIQPLEMKNVVLEKNSIGCFRSRLDTAEVRISELEDSTEN